MLLILWSPQWPGLRQTWWCVHQGLLVCLFRPRSRHVGLVLVRVSLAFAFTIGDGCVPPGTAFPASISMLDLVLPYPIGAIALAADLVGSTP